MNENSMALKYGINPHQKPANISIPSERMPFRILNGRPGYINLMDALNSWQLVNELTKATGKTAAASSKHVSPAGAAVSEPVNEREQKALFIRSDEAESEAALAYARARGADRMSSFGDWAAVSSEVDVGLASFLSREVNHGIIAPGFEKNALEILSKEGKREIRYSSGRN